MDSALPRSRRPPGSGTGSASPEELAHDIRRDVDALVRHGDRRTDGPGHAHAQTYLARRLAELALPTYVGDAHLVPFDGGLVNVLAMIHGADRHRRPLVLATNYDGGDGPAASENAAAVAVILATVPRLRSAALERGVIVALLDDAAPRRHRDTATGATVLLSDQRRHDLKAAVILDRLGRQDERLAPSGTVLVTGAETDARMPTVVQACTTGGVRLAPVHRRYRTEVPLSAPFVDARLPYLELQGGRWAGHGTDDDTPDGIDYALLAELVGVVEALVRRLDTVRLPGPFEGYDSAAFEADALEAALGSSPDAARPSGAGAQARARVDGAMARLAPLLAT